MFDIKNLIGMSEAEAEAGLKSEDGMSFRVRSKDGQEFMATMDYDEKRVNLDIIDGKVVNYSVG